jgi:hypothetical protein
VKSEFVKNLFLFVCGLLLVVGFITQLNFFAGAITYPVYSENSCHELDMCEELYGNEDSPNIDYYFSFAGSEMFFGEYASVEDLVGVMIYLGFFELGFLALGKKLIWDRHYKLVQIRN